MNAPASRRREALLQDLERWVRTVDTLLSRRWPGGEVRRGLALNFLGASPPSATILDTMRGEHWKR
jgi:hypothetical protein